MSSDLAVSRMTGTFEVLRSSAMAVSPSMPGIITSSRMRCTSCMAASRSISLPL